MLEHQQRHSSSQTARAYAGIGSRRTPAHILALMGSIAIAYADRRWTLRTGGADGADTAFEHAAVAAGGPVDLFLPWPGFKRRRGPVACSRPTAEAFAIAARHHPAWERLRDPARALHARNYHQVLGADLRSPAALIICWTPDATTDGRSPASGGNGQALRLAAAHAIPVVNLADRAARLVMTARITA